MRLVLTKLKLSQEERCDERMKLIEVLVSDKKGAKCLHLSYSISIYTVKVQMFSVRSAVGKRFTLFHDHVCHASS